MKSTLEVIATEIQHVLDAQQSGATRIELCAALSTGGLTPSPSLIQLACQKSQLPIMVMIRPREGDFVYSQIEKQSIEHDILFAKNAGAAGIVIGALLDDQTLDFNTLERWIERAYPLEITIHRAFDIAPDPEGNINRLKQMGVAQILSGGGVKRSVDGIQTLLKWQEWAGEELQFLVGGGINSNTIGQCYHPALRQYHMSGSIQTDRFPVQTEWYGPRQDINWKDVAAVANFLKQQELPLAAE